MSGKFDNQDLELFFLHPHGDYVPVDRSGW